MEISGHTRLLCLIGSPVAHSGSPAMYNYSFEKLGLDYRYLAFDIKEEDTKKAIEALKMMNFRGCNITMPGKTVAASCCDELSKAAELTGAVNTIVNEDGKLVGHITDGTGWIHNCLEHGFDIHGKKLVIAGCGGAGTAIQIAAALGGAKDVVILARKSVMQTGKQRCRRSGSMCRSAVQRFLTWRMWAPCAVHWPVPTCSAMPQRLA